MKRPELNEIPIPEDMSREFPQCMGEAQRFGPPCVIREGQWDEDIKQNYENGWAILELDENERLIHLYRTPYS